MNWKTLTIALLSVGFTAFFLGRGTVDKNCQDMTSQPSQEWKEKTKEYHVKLKKTRHARDSLQLLLREAKRRTDSTEKEVSRTEGHIHSLNPDIASDSALRILSTIPLR